MGAWGVGLFSDDTALDVRDGYRDLIGDGLSGPEATDALLGEWGDSTDDPDDGPTFWLALAKTQWQCGRLEDRVKEKALDVIDSGADLRRWDGTPLVKKRGAVLARLRDQLLAEQPPEKRIRKAFRDHCEWELGEIVAYRLRSGKLALLHVVDFHSDKGGTGPIVEILDTTVSDIPSKWRLKRLGVMGMTDTHRATRFLIGRLKEGELPQDRIERTGIVLKPKGRRGRPPRWSVFLWRDLDRRLGDDFGLC